MGFIDFIKNKIFSKFNKNKALPEGKDINLQDASKIGITRMGNSQEQATKQEFDNQIKVDFLPKPQTLDLALQQYVLGLLYQFEHGEHLSSYRVLTGLSALDNTNPGLNAQKEAMVINNVKMSNKLDLIEQKDSTGKVAFNHIMSKKPREEHDTRLYINCKRENVAELADKFINEFGDKPFYFKFCSDSQASRQGRSEQFVFYTNSESGEINDVVTTIERTRQKNPKLFEKSRNCNPFMKNFSGYIAYAPEVDDTFVRLDGKKVPIDRSYNSLLSTALEDSFTHSIGEVASRDYELAEKMGGTPCSDPIVYIQNILQDVVKSPSRLSSLVQNMKKDLVISSRQNPKLEIRGINSQKQNQTELAY